MSGAPDICWPKAWGHPEENRKSSCSSSPGELRLKKRFPSVAKEPSKNHIIQPYCHGLGHLPLDQLLTGCGILNLLPKLCSFALFLQEKVPPPCCLLLLRHPQAPQDRCQHRRQTWLCSIKICCRVGLNFLLTVQFSRFW